MILRQTSVGVTLFSVFPKVHDPFDDFFTTSYNSNLYHTQVLQLNRTQTFTKRDHLSHRHERLIVGGFNPTVCRYVKPSITDIVGTTNVNFPYQRFRNSLYQDPVFGPFSSDVFKYRVSTSPKCLKDFHLRDSFLSSPRFQSLFEQMSNQVDSRDTIDDECSTTCFVST